MTDTAIHIALSIYDPSGTYCRHAGATIASILKNTKSTVRFHILHDTTLSKTNKELLKNTVTELGGEVDFVDLTAIMKERVHVDLEEITGIFTPGTMFRLLIPEVLDVDKVIYLDCDIVVNLDIKNLWDIPIDTHCLAAVEDEGAPAAFSGSCLSRRRFRAHIMNIDTSRYFNAGVLLMNLQKIKKMLSIFDKGIKFLDRYKLCTDLPDQDFLNAVFRDDTLLIDKKFNTPGYSLREDSDVTDKIIHFLSAVKPWTEHNPKTTANILYWTYLSYTAWGNNLVDHILKVPATELQMRTPDLIKYLAYRITRSITLSLPTKIVPDILGTIPIIYREFFYRRNNKSNI